MLLLSPHLAHFPFVFFFLITPSICYDDDDDSYSLMAVEYVS